MASQRRSFRKSNISQIARYRLEFALSIRLPFPPNTTGLPTTPQPAAAPPVSKACWRYQQGKTRAPRGQTPTGGTCTAPSAPLAAMSAGGRGGGCREDGARGGGCREGGACGGACCAGGLRGCEGGAGGGQRGEKFEGNFRKAGDVCVGGELVVGRLRFDSNRFCSTPRCYTRTAFNGSTPISKHP